MRILCDVHIPYRLVNFFHDRGVDATHVNRILNGSLTTDSDITRYADATKSVLITKDSDFRDSHFIQGRPAQVIRIVLGNVSNDELIWLFAQFLPTLQTLFSTTPCYVEIQPSGLRVFRDTHS